MKDKEKNPDRIIDLTPIQNSLWLVYYRNTAVCKMIYYSLMN